MLALVADAEATLEDRVDDTLRDEADDALVGVGLIETALEVFGGVVLVVFGGTALDVFDAAALLVLGGVAFFVVFFLGFFARASRLEADEEPNEYSDPLDSVVPSP